MMDKKIIEFEMGEANRLWELEDRSSYHLMRAGIIALVSIAESLEKLSKCIYGEQYKIFNGDEVDLKFKVIVP